jgi:hypothetical protein
MAIGINAEQNAADRPHEKAHSEGCGGKQQRGVLTFRRKEQACDNNGKKSKHDEVVPFERIANHGGGDLERLRRERFG